MCSPPTASVAPLAPWGPSPTRPRRPPQVTKLTIIPVTLVINAIAYSIYTTAKIKLSLAILLLGVGVATVTDVQLRPLGMGFGLAAVLTTALFQIWQGTKQKEFGVSATQLQAGIAMWQAIQAFSVAAVAENVCWDGSDCERSIDFFQSAFGGDQGKMRTLTLVLGTCFLALAVNLCSFGLIGRTSPTTFQVVGHLKTCLVLTGGYVFFPAKLVDTQQLYNNVMGVSVAMVGCVLYGHLKDAAGQEKADCLDCICPGVVLSVIEPRYSALQNEETEGLKAASEGRAGA